MDDHTFCFGVRMRLPTRAKFAKCERGIRGDENRGSDKGDAGSKTSFDSGSAHIRRYHSHRADTYFAPLAAYT